MKCFCCCVSKFIRILLGETFSRRSARDKKDLKKKKRQHKQDDERAKKTKERFEILRETTTNF